MERRTTKTKKGFGDNLRGKRKRGRN